MFRRYVITVATLFAFLGVILACGYFLGHSRYYLSQVASAIHDSGELKSNPVPNGLDLYNKYQACLVGGAPVKVMLMPGHEPDYGGAEYRNYLERDLNVELSDKLFSLLSADRCLAVVVARTKQAWTPSLATYLESNQSAIAEWVSGKKAEYERLASTGDIIDYDDSFHLTIKREAALRLYGVSKYLNDNAFDLAIHVHFNDDPERGSKWRGKYTGFAVYIPDRQYDNYEVSNAVARTIYEDLGEIIEPSTLKQEFLGLIEDQELIAVGSFNTANFASLLIEYSFFYEDKVRNPKKQEATLDQYAEQTAHGLFRFFGK